MLSIFKYFLIFMFSWCHFWIFSCFNDLERACQTLALFIQLHSFDESIWTQLNFLVILYQIYHKINSKIESHSECFINDLDKEISIHTIHVWGTYTIDQLKDGGIKASSVSPILIAAAAGGTC